MDKKTSNYIVALLVTIFLLSITSTSFSYMRVSLEQKGEDKITDIKTVTVEVTYPQSKTWYIENLNSEEEYSYTFKLTNTSNKPVSVDLYLNQLEDNFDDNDDVFLHVYKNEDEIYGTNNLNESFVLDLGAYEENDYTLKLEVNSSGEGKYIHSEVQVRNK